MGLFQFSMLDCATQWLLLHELPLNMFFIGVWDSCTWVFKISAGRRLWRECWENAENRGGEAGEWDVYEPQGGANITAPDITVKTSLEGLNINEQVNIRCGGVTWYPFCHPMVKGGMDMSDRVPVSHPIASLLGGRDYLLYQMTTSWPSSTQPLEASARAVIDLPAETWASIRGRGSRSIHYTHLCFTDIRANDVPARTTANF